MNANIKLSSQCKICRLIDHDQKLWVEVHKKVIEDGLPNSSVCKWLNNQIDVVNANSDGNPITKFNNANFTNHFKNHISDMDSMNVELKKWISSGVKEVSTFDDDQKALANSFEDPSKSEYDKISDMIGMMEENLVLYSKDLRERRENSTRKIPVNPREIDNYSKFVSDLISAKQNLAKLRSAEQATIMAIDSAIEIIVRGIAKRTVELSNEVRNMLISELDDNNSLPDQISKIIKSTLGGEMRGLVNESKLIVKKNFGLK